MRTSNFSHDFFDKWTEQSAYIFGFWYADGSIELHKNPYGYLHKAFFINNTDKQIIDYISAVLGIIPCIKQPRCKKCKLSYQLSVHSDKFFDFCYSFVGSIDKTHSVLSPFAKIPNKYLHHFVRGYFDGDGTIYHKKYKSRHGKLLINLSSSFTASKESIVVLDDLKQLLMVKIGVGDKKVVIQKDKNNGGSGSKLVFNQYDTMLLCQWMYNDATIFMKRKKDIWDNFDKEKLRNSVKYFSNKV